MRRVALLAVSGLLVVVFAVAASGVDAATRPFWWAVPKPKPAPPAPPAPPTVSAPMVNAPADPVGTVILVHRGGWMGPDRAKHASLAKAVFLVSLETPIAEARERYASVVAFAANDATGTVEELRGTDRRRPRRA